MNMKETNFNPTNTKLTGYGGMRLKVKGKCDVQCRYKDSRCVASFYIVDTDSPAVLGLQTCVDLGLIKLVMSLSTSSEVDGILQQYSCVFKGLGCLKQPYRIKIDNSVNPVIHPPRRIPAALRDRVKATLDEMEKMEVIRKVDEPTEWVNSMVTVEKPNSNKLRICLDPKDLNVAIQREHFELPTVEEITAHVWRG